MAEGARRERPGAGSRRRRNARSWKAGFARAPRSSGITSLPGGSLDPNKPLQLPRDHWAIENSLFHIRDATFREGSCRVRTGSAPQALAAIRDGVLNYIRQTGQKPRPAREAFTESKWKAIRLVRRL